MSFQIAVRIPDDERAALDDAVASGRFPSRAAAIREGLTLLLREERGQVIAAEYRRAYSKQPQEEWVGEAGEAAAGEVIADADRAART